MTQPGIIATLKSLCHKRTMCGWNDWKYCATVRNWAKNIRNFYPLHLMRSYVTVHSLYFGCEMNLQRNPNKWADYRYIKYICGLKTPCGNPQILPGMCKSSKEFLPSLSIHKWNWQNWSYFAISFLLIIQLKWLPLHLTIALHVFLPLTMSWDIANGFICYWQHIGHIAIVSRIIWYTRPHNSWISIDRDSDIDIRYQYSKISLPLDSPHIASKCCFLFSDNLSAFPCKTFEPRITSSIRISCTPQ